MADTKHHGCYVCGTLEQPILSSVPSPVPLDKGSSIALCDKCIALSRADLYAKVKAIQEAMREAMRKAREAVVNG